MFCSFEQPTAGISLNGSTVVPDDGETVTLKLTENQRIRAMAISERQVAIHFRLWSI